MISSAEYDERIFITFWNWCKDRASSESETQELLANARVNKWFLNQYTQLENEFIQLVETFPKKLRDAKPEYYRTTTEIFNLYPKPLLDGYKNNKDFKISLNEKIEIYAN